MDRHVKIIFATLTIISCSTNDSKKNSDTHTMIDHQNIVEIGPDTLEPNEKPTNYIGGKPAVDSNLQIGGHTVREYLNDVNVPKEFKALCTDYPWSLTTKTMSIADSIESKDALRQPFYLLTFSHALQFCDGAFAEVLSSKTKTFLENRPEQFIQFYNDSIIKNVDYRNWIEHISNEIAIMIESGDKGALSNFKKESTKNCSTCDVATRKQQTKMLSEIDKLVKMFME